MRPITTVGTQSMALGIAELRLTVDRFAWCRVTNRVTDWT